MDGWVDTVTVKGYNEELNIVTSSHFDLVGNLVKTVDGNGKETIYQYDDLNGLKQTIYPEVFDFDSQTDTNPVTYLKRNKNRQVTGSKDARGNWTLTEYDGMLRPLKVIIEVSAQDAQNIIKEYRYD